MHWRRNTKWNFTRLRWASSTSANSSCRTRLRLGARSEEHTSELQSHHDLVCRLLLEKKNQKHRTDRTSTLIHSQVPLQTWHEGIGKAILADASGGRVGERAYHHDLHTP